MNGFISYAHADFEMYQAFQKQLTPAARHLGIHFWSDPSLHTGQDWNSAIEKAIYTADVFVALVSCESLYSEYISQRELPAMRERSGAVSALILPVVLNRCSWDFEFGRLQATPTIRGQLRPIADWNPKHHGYHQASVQAAEAISHYYKLPIGGGL